MAGLDDLFAQIPIQDIAQNLGVGADEVDATVRTLVPVLVGGLNENAQNPENLTTIESAATSHAARGLLDTGVSVDQVDQADGQKAIAKIFGGNDSEQVAAALSGAGVGNGDLVKQLLPILAPIVLAYIGKQLGQQNAPAQQQASGGGLADVLGSILGGGSRSNTAMGTILGDLLGGKTGNAIGGILGGLLGNK